MNFKTRNCLFNFLKILLACILTPVFLISAEEIKKTENKKSKRVFSVCTHNLPPHSMLIENQKPGGLATEVLNHVADSLNWQLDISYYPWLRSRANAENGECDMIYTILKKDEYLNIVKYPEQSLELRYNVIIVLKNSTINFDGNLKKFMKNYTVGIYQDKVVSPLFDKLKKQPWARVEYTTDPESNLQKLLNSHVDAIIENQHTAIYQLRKLNRLEDVRILKPTLSETPSYIAFSKKGKAVKFIKEFDQALKAFKTTEQYQKIYRENK